MEGTSLPPSDSDLVSRFGQLLPPHRPPGNPGTRVRKRWVCTLAAREGSHIKAKLLLWLGDPSGGAAGGLVLFCQCCSSHRWWLENRGGDSGGASLGATSPHGPCSPPSSKPQPGMSQQPWVHAHSPESVAFERPDSTVLPWVCRLAWMVQPGAPNHNSSRTKDVTTPKVCPVLCLEEEIEC